MEIVSSLSFDILGIPLYNEADRDETSIYVQTSAPDSWDNLETTCLASSGHLVSLNNYDLEEILGDATDLDDYWCGGNMCNDYTPPTPDSMWSDGSPQDSANFALKSGLDWSHCCVKVDVFDPAANGSVWKGEDCDRVLHGICEFKVEGNIRNHLDIYSCTNTLYPILLKLEYLDMPTDIVSTPLAPTILNVTFTSEMRFWRPTEYTVDNPFVPLFLSSAINAVYPRLSTAT